jgi:hypothetical protein
MLAGDLAVLHELAARMDAAADGPLPAPDAHAADRLRRKAARNRACLAAAAAGLRAAQRRLREIAAAAAGGSVYDGSGRAHAVAAAPGRMVSRL